MRVDVLVELVDEDGYRRNIMKRWRRRRSGSANWRSSDRIDNLRDISMAPQEFLKKYAMESILLAWALDKIDKVLKTRLLDSVCQITGSRKA